ncbi:hypothetical protein V6N11_057074 [Hibiscus sabdariffa]|uniref:Uncharacterized protein n=1 Tax=Hibiscus sabdariffa TaxID=183260 RepID=A0ABR1ZVV9_9ROSI
MGRHVTCCNFWSLLSRYFENPTETIVSNLKEYTEKKGLPKGVILGSCSVLETAGQGAVTQLYQTLRSALTGKDSESSCSGRIIWLHFGVNSGACRFAIERQAANEATFRCPDEMGWKPQKVPIVPADGGIARIRETSLPVEEINEGLSKEGSGVKSLFVHVPLFLTIDEETQMKFAASLLERMYLRDGLWDIVSSIFGVICFLHQAINWWNSLCEDTSMSIPAKGNCHDVSSGDGLQLDLCQCKVYAWSRVATSKTHVDF